MAKYSFSFTDSQVVITDDKTNKNEPKLDLLEPVALPVAFRALTRGRQADNKASDVAISMLVECLQSPRLDEFKGKTPHNEKVPAVFLGALRDVETDVYKPAFVASHTEKGATAGKVEQLWQDFRKDELNTGSYSNARSFVVKMFAHMGQLPMAPNGKLLPLHAIKRMYEAWKSEQEGETDKGTIAHKLVKLSAELHTVSGGANMGELVTGIDALKKMLATYETMYTVYLQQLTEAKMGSSVAPAASVAEQAQEVTDKAKGGRRKAPAKQEAAEPAPF